MATTNAAYYRSLPYRRVVDKVVEEDGAMYYLARIQEIPWMEIDGDTREEALLRLDEEFDHMIQAMIDRGTEIPEPPAWPYSDATPGAPPAAAPRGRIGHVALRKPVDMGAAREDLPPFTPIARRAVLVGAED